MRILQILLALLQDLQLTWSLMWDSRVPAFPKLVPVVAAAYVLMPVDFVPDLLLGLGQLDDLAIVSLGLKAFLDLVPAPLVAEHRDWIRSGRRRSANRDHRSETVVEGQYRVVDDRR